MTSLTRSDRRELGRAARQRVPREAHAEYVPSVQRDPVGLLLGQAGTRVAELVPIRHARMLESPFAFFRGAALPMAADLATTPTTGLRVQLCGDAHVANFGVFSSPERRLVFDLNDFDETLPGPFEWDVKRFAASLAVAGRDLGLSGQDRSDVLRAGVRSYRTSVAAFAEMPLMAVWYAHLDADELISRVDQQLSKKALDRTRKAFAKARSRDALSALAKLTTVVDGRQRFVSDPPLVVPVEELNTDREADDLYAWLTGLLRRYRSTLQPDRRHLVEQFRLTAVARKVVGVGSVGTRVWLLLMEADDDGGPLLLQAKEAQRSVLADYCGDGRDRNEGRRVVTGQRLMQATSDIVLGWQRVTGLDGLVRDFYIRQLRDGKYSPSLERMTPAGLMVYAELCGWTLARAHARSGDRVAVAAYLGGSDRFDRAVAAFAERYADQTERDHATLASAVSEGRVLAHQGG